MFSFFSKKDKSPPEPPEQYTNIRNSILMSSAMQLNIQPTGKYPDVWGVLVDENFDKHIQSAWVTANGQIQIFQFAGESPIREDPLLDVNVTFLILDCSCKGQVNKASVVLEINNGVPPYIINSQEPLFGNTSTFRVYPGSKLSLTVTSSDGLMWEEILDTPFRCSPPPTDCKNSSFLN